MADPAASGAAYGQMIGIYQAGGWELVEQVAKNLVISDNNQGPRSVSDGEAALGLFNEPSVAAFSENPQVGMTYPSEGSTAGWGDVYLIEGTSRSEAANALASWLIGDEGSQMIVDELPGLRSTVTGADTPVGFAPIDELTIAEFPGDSVTNKAAWLSEWEEIVTNL